MMLSAMLLVAPLALSHDTKTRTTGLSPREERASCHALARAVPRGAAIDAAAVEPVLCKEQKPAPVVFDRTDGRVLAAGDLPAGAYLGRLFFRESVGVHKGDTLRLVSRVGPVRIERVVTAMQPSDGRRIFVRDADGQVYSAPLTALGARQ